MAFHLRKPSSFTAVDDTVGAASENTSTNRLPAVLEAPPMGAAERMPRRSADGEGVDWKIEAGYSAAKCNLVVAIKEKVMKKQSWFTAFEAATAAVSGPRSLPPFSSLPSLLLSSSSVTDTAPGPFFFLSLARIDDSRSGKGGISSRTVA